MSSFVDSYSELFVGNEEDSLNFFIWASELAQSLRGWMTVTLLERNEDHFSQVFRGTKLVTATELTTLQELGMTHGVLLSMFNYDDETDYASDNASSMNMLRCLSSGFSYWATLEEDERFRVDQKNNCLILPSLPFRLDLWRPLETSFGFHQHQQDEDADKQRLIDQGLQPVDWSE